VVELGVVDLQPVELGQGGVTIGRPIDSTTVWIRNSSLGHFSRVDLGHFLRALKRGLGGCGGATSPGDLDARELGRERGDLPGLEPVRAYQARTFTPGQLGEARAASVAVGRRSRGPRRSARWPPRCTARSAPRIQHPAGVAPSNG